MPWTHLGCGCQTGKEHNLFYECHGLSGVCDKRSCKLRVKIGKFKSLEIVAEGSGVLLFIVKNMFAILKII